jgi:hypothetical protein
MKKIKISTQHLQLSAVLFDTPTSQVILRNLPLHGTATQWGKEIYFHTLLDIAQEEDARESVNIGELAFWPQGGAFCIFYGATPASTDRTPRAISPVNVFGKIVDNIEKLDEIRQGTEITITLA